MKVRYDAASSALQVDVCDTGHGIAADRLEAIFEPFEQESAATSRNSGGTGLGLAISKRLMEAMHGTLAVESEIGRGSRFSLSCPAPAVAVAVADDSARQVPFPRRRASDNKGADFTGLQILVADDNRANQLVASAVLASMGIRHVAVAYDGYAIFGPEEDRAIPSDLDECSGHVSVTAEFGEVYHYHLTYDSPNLPTCRVGAAAVGTLSSPDNANVALPNGEGAGGGPGGGPSGPPPGG